MACLVKVKFRTDDNKKSSEQYFSIILSYVAFDVSDIDECALPTGGHICSYRCHNTPGSFHCSCPVSGYTLAPNGRSCQGKRVSYQTPTCWFILVIQQDFNDLDFFSFCRCWWMSDRNTHMRGESKLLQHTRRIPMPLLWMPKQLPPRWRDVSALIVLFLHIYIDLSIYRSIGLYIDIYTCTYTHSHTQTQNVQASPGQAVTRPMTFKYGSSHACPVYSALE